MPNVINGDELKNTIIGTPVADVIKSLEKNDKVYGEDGDDDIEAGDGTDKVEGGAGNDTIDGGDGKDQLYGGLDNDLILGGQGKDKIYGEDGDDELDGGEGRDRLMGGSGNDILRGGEGRDKLHGGDDNDTLFGGDGNDRVEGDDGDDVVHGEEGDDYLEGGDGNDVLFGGDDDDKLYGQNGQDTLEGDDGDDFLRGGRDRDELYGEEGDDTLDGGKGGDLLLGGVGDDSLYGHHGADTIFGGADDDEIDGHKGRDSIDAGTGNDVVLGGKGQDTIKGYTGDDDIDGERGDDLFLHDLDFEAGDSDTYAGGRDHDTVRWFVTQDTWFSLDLQEDRFHFLGFKDGVDFEDHDHERDNDETTLNNWDLTMGGFEHLEIAVDTTGATGHYDASGATDHDDTAASQVKFYDNVAVYDNSVDLVDDDATTIFIDEHSGPVVVSNSVLDNDTVEDWVFSIRMDANNTLGTVTFVNGDELNPSEFATAGKVTFDANGVGGAPGAYEYLAQGETVDHTIDYRVVDADRDEAVASVIVRVTGVNDVITANSADDTGAASTGATVATGDIVVDDIDLIDNHTWTFVSTGTTSVAGTYGAWTLVDNEAGESQGSTNATWTYTLDTADADYIALGQGATSDEVVTIRVDDGQGSTLDQVVTVTVTGVNDAPTFSATDNTGAVAEDGAASDSGDYDISDVDVGDTHDFFVKDGGANAGSKAGAYGTLSMNQATGTWTYNINNAAAQSLANGETADEVFTVAGVDNHGAEVTDTVTVTVTGAGDDAVIAVNGVSDLSVTEDGDTAASGDFDETDVDAIDTHAWFVDDGGANVASLLGTYGTLTMTEATGSWSYTLDSATAQSIAAGDSETDSFTIAVLDSGGNRVTETVSITVNGANDAPVMAAPAVAFDLATEEDADGTAGGTFAATDVDAGDGQTWTHTGGAGGAFGAFSIINAATGQWQYILDNVAAQSLAEGQTVNEVFDVEVSDGNGGTATTSVTVVVTGDQDAITIDGGGAITGGVTEDGGAAQVDTGDLDATDLDLTDPENWSILAQGAHGTASVDANGTWTYTLSNGSAAVQALDSTDPALVDTFTVEVSDGTATDTVVVSIDISGANDAPVGVDDNAGTFANEAFSFTQASLTANDTDVDVEALSISGVTVSNLGAVVGLNGGNIDFDASATATATGGLAGTVVADFFEYTVTDGDLSDTVRVDLEWTVV